MRGALTIPRGKDHPLSKMEGHHKEAEPTGLVEFPPVYHPCLLLLNLSYLSRTAHSSSNTFNSFFVSSFPYEVSHIKYVCVLLSCESVLVSPISEQARNPKRMEEKFFSSTEESKVSLFISNGSIEVATLYKDALDTFRTVLQHL